MEGRAEGRTHKKREAQGHGLKRDDGKAEKTVEALPYLLEGNHRQKNQAAPGKVAYIEKSDPRNHKPPKLKRDAVSRVPGCLSFSVLFSLFLR